MCASHQYEHQQWRDWISRDIEYIKVCLDLPIAPD
jgi:hypothetical protein